MSEQTFLTNSNRVPLILKVGEPGPEPSSASGFTGATIPVIWTEAPEDMRTFDYASASPITISGLDSSVATITNNGTTSVKVVFNSGLGSTRYNFTIENGGHTFNGSCMNYTETLADGNCIVVYNEASDSDTQLDYFFKVATSLPVFSSSQSLWNSIGSHQVCGFSFGKWSGNSIGNYFLGYCYSFNQPFTIPSSVTTIGTYFLGCCYSFNQPLTIPSSVTNISFYFLSNCYAFNQPLTIPSSVTNIGFYFLNCCYSFNQPLTIPSSVTSIGSGFLYSCYAFTRLITNTTASPTDDYSLSDTRISTSVYRTKKLSGTGASTWKSNLPDKTSSTYRTLVVVS